MTFLPVSDATLMTLAGIAYGAPGDIATYLGEAAPTKSDWSLVWLAAPPDPPVNFAYLARSARTGDCVLAIRGTYPDPFSPAYWDDGAQDSPFGAMVDWPGAPGPRISAGTSLGISNLLTLTDAGGITLVAAVAALQPDNALTVTGHSLGGTLAPVMALHLAGVFPQARITAVSFAGMTPGNGAFAALFDAGTLLAAPVRRVFNTLDSVSYGWNKVDATIDFYQPAPRGGPLVAAMLLATAARLALEGYDYAPVGIDVPLTGSVAPVTIPCDLVAFVFETLHQHMPDTYLGLLGAPPLPFHILFGTIVTPRGGERPLRRPTAYLPVVYTKADARPG